MRDLDHDVDAVLDLVKRRLGDGIVGGKRHLIAIAGPPGSGKSTLASRVVDALNEVTNDVAALLPMDGFHLDNDDLDARGLRHVKGAPETFDAEGFVGLVRRVRQGGMDMRFPLFDRAQDRTLPGAGMLHANTPFVLIEGNYLLLRRAPWAELRRLFDLSVMLAPPLAELETRLIARWRDHGLPPDKAAERARGNDFKNARTVIAESAEADLFLGDSSDP